MWVAQVTPLHNGVSSDLNEQLQALADRFEGKIQFSILLVNHTCIIAKPIERIIPSEEADLLRYILEQLLLEVIDA